MIVMKNKDCAPAGAVLYLYGFNTTLRYIFRISGNTGICRGEMPAPDGTTGREKAVNRAQAVYAARFRYCSMPGR